MKIREPRPIREFCLGIYDGPHATPKESTEGAVFLGIKNITADGHLDLAEIRYVSEEDLPRWTRRVTPQAGDVVLTYEATLHRYAVIPEGFRGCLGRRVALIRPDLTKADSRYLLYYFQSAGWRKVVESNVITGATVDRIPLERLPDFPVTLPEVETQREVAQKLSAYDALIENNRRRMVLLEDAARLIYEEWFVHLRFPGYQCTDEAAEKWRPLTLDDLCTIGRGASPRPIAKFMEGKIPWFKIGDATASESPYVFVTAEHVTDEGAKKSIVLQPGSLILSNSATCGIPFFTAVTGCIHDGWLHFDVLKRISPEFLYCYLQNKRIEVVSSVSDGSTQKNLNTSAVGRLRLSLPPTNALLVKFDNLVQPLFSMIFNLARQNISLRAARDLLLPRLVNGE